MTEGTVSSCRSGLLGFGAGIADLVASVPAGFLEDYGIRKGDAQEIGPERMKAIIAALPVPPVQMPGGATANTLYAFAGMGGRAGMLSRFGGDSAGKMLLHHFQGAGIDLAGIRIAAEESTGCCLVLVSPDSERSMLTMQGAFAGIRPDTFQAQDFQGYSHFYMEGYSLYFPETALRVLQMARKAGLCICYDMGSPNIVRSQAVFLADILGQYVDVVFANEQENAEFTAASGGKADALASLCRTAVIKAGAAGARILTEGRELLIPAAGTEVRDTTGAGDYWAAGFLNGWLRGKSLSEAGRQGAAAAAAVIGISGANLSLNKLKQIEELFL